MDLLSPVHMWYNEFECACASIRGQFEVQQEKFVCMVSDFYIVICFISVYAGQQ